ncbi:MAG TPA: XDD4 family exosortase-dependent surface protein [Verrucomicrobiae bacterium]|nr:XDD4 family exosortase-dependent surface protein [Verrucomicrobiae bacterium]
MKTVARGLVALALIFVGGTAHGVTYTATNRTLSASASFAVSDLKLVITLSNTATNDPGNSAEILTGIFFTLAGGPALTPVSALLGPNTAIKDRPGVSGPGTNVGGEWAYRNRLPSLPHGANEGISSTSLKAFTQHFRFPGPNLQGSAAPSGVQYGVTTDFDNMGNDKGSLKHQQLIESTVIFTLSGLPANFVLANITNVSFQYGTSLKDANLNLAGTIAGDNGGPAIPEPGTGVLIATGLLWAFALVRRSKALSATRGRVANRQVDPSQNNTS